MLLFICLSVMAGISVVVARIINFRLANEIGIVQGTFYNYVVGLFFSLTFMFLSGEFLNIPNVQFGSLPLWAYIGGMCGVIVVMLSSYITPKVSSFYLTLLIFIGQLFVGIIIDFFTAGHLSTGKIIGGLFVLAGLTYNLVVDRKKPMMAT